MIISDDILEKIANKIHDRWMAKRIEEGWLYGSERNEKKKEHPCIVPYEELSELEKEYDRATARETLLSLDELGYEIILRK